MIDKTLKYARLAERVMQEHGVSRLLQILDVVRLRRFQGRVGPGDYHEYRLFDKALSLGEKGRFVGWKAESKLDALNESSWHCLGLDKVLMYSVLGSNGVLVPDTRAIYLPNRIRPLAGAQPLVSTADLGVWLRTSSNYPFFSKPSASGFGRAAFLAAGYEEASDSVRLQEGSCFTVNDFINECQDVERLGYLFQAPIQPDESLVSALGRTATSLRMMVLADEEEGPTLFRCFWKLPTGRNTVDNYNGGKTGNLAAAVDLRSGRIVRVISGTGLDVIDVEHHPDSGVPLRTLGVPDWQGVVDFVLNAALSFPKLRFQQWDIALSAGGPMALEVNLFGTGGQELSQLLYRQGLLDHTMLSYLRRRGIA